jgi:flagellin-like hook-associated protein FlgL
MNLSDTNAMLAKKDFESALARYGNASRKIASGTKLVGKDLNLGDLSASINLSSDKQYLQSEKISVQNFLTFLDSQEKALLQVDQLYKRMEGLAYSALDVALRENGDGVSSDKALLNKEFEEISAALEALVDLEVSGRRLFGGIRSDFTDGLQDRNDFTPTNLPQVTTKDVLATSGKITVELCPGGAEDQIWVFQGGVPDELSTYFKAPPGGGNADTAGLTAKLYEYFDGTKDDNFQGIFTTGRWQTVGNSSQGRFDKFTVDFNTCDAELSVEYHGDNVTPNGVLPDNPSDSDILSANFNQLFGEHLKRRLELDGELLLNAPNGNNTTITMIGVNTGNTFTYEVTAAFEPSLPYNDLVSPSSGDIFPAISFGAIDCADISTSENALNALKQIDAQKEGLYDSLSQVGAAQSRYQFLIDNIDQQVVNLDVAQGRIVDADIARESTVLAKEAISMQFAANAVSNSNKLVDALINMTTKHFRSHVLDSILR